VTANVRDYGAKGDGQADDADAFDAAIASMGSGGRGTTLFAPRGTYRISRPVSLTKTLRFVGAGGYGQDPATIIKPDPGVDGILVNGWSGGARADYSSIEDLAVYGNGRDCGDGARGVFAQARVEMTRVGVLEMGGNGIELYGNVGQGSNVSVSRLMSVRVGSCGGDGIRIGGPDANAIEIHGDVADNRGWGIRDRSFLGCHMIACHASNNGAGPYCVEQSTAIGTLAYCYSEEGGGPSVVGPNSYVVGGFHGAGIIGGHSDVAGVSSPRVFKTPAGHSLGIGSDGPPNDLLTFDPQSALSHSPFGANRYGLDGNWIGLEYAHAGYLGLALPLMGATRGGRAGAPVFPGAFDVGGTRIIATRGRPHEGEFRKGDVAVNEWATDASGDPNSVPWQGGVLWACTSTGVYGSATEPVWKCCARIEP